MGSAWLMVVFFIFCATAGWGRYRATRQRIYLIPIAATLGAATLSLCMALRLI
jgi:hypothetical protein